MIYCHANYLALFYQALEFSFLCFHFNGSNEAHREKFLQLLPRSPSLKYYVFDVNVGNMQLKYQEVQIDYNNFDI